MNGIIGNTSSNANKSWTRYLNFNSDRPTEDLETETRIVDEWTGYAKLAAFQTGQPNFSVYRSFNYLYGRVLLELQYDITSLEQKLDDCDRFDMQNDRKELLSSINRDTHKDLQSVRAMLGGATDLPHPETGSQTASSSLSQPPESFGLKASAQPTPRDDSGPPYRRRVIVEQLKEKLKDYGDLLRVARDVAAFRKPSDRDYKSVRTFVDGARPLAIKEGLLFQRKEDFITLHQGREWALFDGFFVGIAIQIPLIRKWLQTPELRVKTSDKRIHFYDNERVEQTASYIVMPILCALLVSPIIAMYALNKSKLSPALLKAVGVFGVLIAFLLLFALSMPLLTKAGRNEMFAASAAYCAVLVVFVSNLLTNPNP